MTEEEQACAAALVGNTPRNGAVPPRHLLREPAPQERLLPGTGADLCDWRRMMTVLVRQSPGPENRPDNPTMAAGHTYLLQLVAHDLVEMKGLPRSSSDGVGGVIDGRGERLVLETIYGTAASRPPRNGRYLLLGAARDKGKPIPDRDIPRDLQGNKTLVADFRNDLHSNISQLTALFLQLHNAIAGLLPHTLDDAVAFDRARAAAVLLYREVIRRELLPKLLDPRVDALYGARRPILEPNPSPGIAVEFAAGIFRFGHAMVREKYELVGNGGYIGVILQQSMANNPHASMPLRADLLVRWGRFFQLPGQAAPEPSKALVPVPPGHLLVGNRPPLEGDADDRRSMMYRDLNAALLFGLWSPYALATAIKRADRRFDFLPSKPVVEAAIANWLAAQREFSGAPRATRKIAANPPLPFYALFEAWWAEGGNGLRLGPLGSVVTAEAICGALEHGRPAFEGAALDASLQAVDPALERLARQASMAGIVTLVAGHYGWNQVTPAFV